MRLGEMFAGIGGLSLAVQWAFEDADDAKVKHVWQLDSVESTAHVRHRHFPDCKQVVADVRESGWLEAVSALGPIDVLSGGFSCKDVSVAGKRELLEGKHTGPTYRAMLDAIAACSPEWVVLENTPGLLTKLRGQIDMDLSALGYGTAWVRARALDVGAPHIRRRVFVVARRGGVNKAEPIDCDRSAEWQPDSSRHRPTATGSNPNEGEGMASWQARSDKLVAAGSRPLSEPLGLSVRTWPTTTTGDAKASGSRSLDSSKANAGTSLTDAVRPDRVTADERTWATMTATQAEKPGQRPGRDGVGEGLGAQVRPWATATGSDEKGGYGIYAPSRGLLRSQGETGVTVPGRRLNPDFCEILMGFPVGWTHPTGPQLEALRQPLFPRGRYPKDWDRSIPWEGYSQEPHRTIPDGKPMKGRPARLRGTGNAVCPQQGALAIWTGMRWFLMFPRQHS